MNDQIPVPRSRLPGVEPSNDFGDACCSTAGEASSAGKAGAVELAGSVERMQREVIETRTRRTDPRAGDPSDGRFGDVPSALRDPRLRAGRPGERRPIEGTRPLEGRENNPSTSGERTRGVLCAFETHQ